MANIKMASQMLGITYQKLERSCDVENPQFQHYLNILSGECNREIGLINDLLDLQKLESGTKPLDMQRITVKPLLVNLVEPFRDAATKNDRTLIVKIDDTLPIITSSPLDLERIISELLNNAIKYTPKGNEIVIEASADASYLSISITNYGVEIPESEQKKVFDKFYRITSIDKYKHGGTGLGLSLIKKLVEHIGGNIELHSKDNYTSFLVILLISP